MTAIFYAALLGAAWTSRAEDDVQEAVESINRQIQAHPKDNRLLVQRSRLMALAKKYDLALSDLDEANRIAPLPELNREKASVYWTAGWHETGLQLINQHLARYTNDVDGYLLRARLNVQLGRRADAGADFASAIQRTKEPTIDLYLERARALTTEDGAHVKEAMATIQEAIQRIGPIITLQSAALELEMQQGQYDAALKRVDDITRTASRKDTWLARRGDLLVQAGRIQEARTAYQQALSAVEKLPPTQRAQPNTRELERQLRGILANSEDLAKAMAIRQKPRMLVTTNSAVSPQSHLSGLTNEPALPAGGKIRTYHVAAEEVDWDYAVAGNWIREPFCGDPDAIPGQAPGRIGTRYKKAIFREYTDSTFQRLVVRPGPWQHLGLLGPLFRAEVGDRIRVVFRNKTRFFASLHPHGVFYLKTSEGSGYNDGTAPSEQKDDAVPPGASHVYDWPVPERAGPGPADGSSLAWLYHSHVHAPRDGNAGLVGAMIVTARGKAKPDGSPNDVDREFVTLFKIFNENLSSYFDLNLQTHFGTTNPPALRDPLFIESNLKHSINGHIFGNVPHLTMKVGERVRWYLLALGNEVDLHTPHWHGNTVLWQGHRTDVIDLLPASMKVADMVPDNPGMWLFHCHVNDHMLEGMSALYQVMPK